MPPLRNGRAPKACSACRRQKTRCFESGKSKSCLRCENTDQPCSLAREATERKTELLGAGCSNEESMTISLNEGLINARFERLEQSVRTLQERLDDHASISASKRVSPTAIEIQRDESTFAPVLAIRDVAQEVGLPAQRSVIEIPAPGLSLVQKGLLSQEKANALLEIFAEHYGRWIGLSSPEQIEGFPLQVGESPLLQSACCVIAMRHLALDEGPQLSRELFHEAKSRLASRMLESPQSLDFFQAALILSLWSTTVGQEPLSIDGWLLTSFALQHTQASGLFTTLQEKCTTQEVHKRRTVWNHLCLAHLQYCTGVRRRTVLQSDDIQTCRMILNKDPTNFELRMVAEIDLYWLLYRTTMTAVDLADAQNKLRSWKHEWAFLFGQLRAQFLEMGFHFAQLLLYHLSLTTRSTAAKESLIAEMTKVSTAIINLAMTTADERTPYLTDHIYHMITFAAVTLCRLLHMYEKQVSETSDVQELDRLIVQLAEWLRTIGLPSHVAFILGNVVAAFHRKLRPESHAHVHHGLHVSETTPEDLSFFFPEILGMDSFGQCTQDLLPDWEPFFT